MVAGGYESFATSTSDGMVLFDEKDFLEPGEHYYRISEISDYSVNDPDYEDAVYEYDG